MALGRFNFAAARTATFWLVGSPQRTPSYASGTAGSLGPGLARNLAQCTGDKLARQQVMACS